MAPAWTKEGALWPHPRMTFQFLEDPVEERNSKDFLIRPNNSIWILDGLQVKTLPESARACFLVPVPQLQAVLDLVWN